MCGLTGVISRPPIHAPRLEAITATMTATLEHRGPDMAGTWCDPVEGIGLGHRRLSILDLSEEGRQPMISRSGRYALVYNGEIYNFAEIRERLGTAGHPVEARGDTAVLLAAIDTWGIERTLPRLSGMFALALWDNRERRLFLARDPAGKKPLYYGLSAGSFLFASELKAICAFPAFERRIDRGALTAFFRDSYIAAPLTIWEGISKLAPGSMVTIDASGPVLSLSAPQAFWSWSDMAHERSQRPFAGSDEEAVDELERTLRQAVRDRMVADVPVGAFLSGGVDSSVIAALMQQESSQSIHTFTIGFQEADFDESGEARLIAEQIGARHCDLLLSPAAARDGIGDLVQVYDEPFADMSAIPMVHLAKLARSDVAVCLSGDGGDELFGGYARYALTESLAKRLDGIPRWLRASVGKGARAIPPRWWDAFVRQVPHSPLPLLRGSVSGDRVHKLAGLLDAADTASLYRQLTSVCAHPEAFVHDGVEPSSASSPAALSTDLQHMMLRDSLSYLPDDILVKVDRATMSVGLEARAPLLDRRIIEFAWSLPPTMLKRDGLGKWPLRRLCNRLLPERHESRPKRGFSVPMAEWLRGPLRAWGQDMLSNSALVSSGVLRTEPVTRMWQEHLSGDRQWSAQLWTVFMACAWADEWLPVSVPRESARAVETAA